MPGKRKPLMESLDEDTLRQLATPSNFRYGKETFDQGGVEFAHRGRFDAKATVQPSGGQKRTVILKSADGGVSCQCTCTLQAGTFCKHCVAAGLAVLAQQPA